MAETEKVAGGRQAAAPVGRAHGRRVVQRFPGRVQRHHGNRARRQPGLLARVRLEVDGDQPGGPPRQDLVDPGAPRPVAPVDLGERHGKLMLPGDLLHPAQDLHREMAFQRPERHLEDGHRADRLRPAVTLLVQNRLDPAAGRR
jgi:hypothetical protein